jgi:hypothetical protein
MPERDQIPVLEAPGMWPASCCDACRHRISKCWSSGHAENVTRPLTSVECSPTPCASKSHSIGRHFHRRAIGVLAATPRHGSLLTGPRRTGGISGLSTSRLISIGILRAVYGHTTERRSGSFAVLVRSTMAGGRAACRTARVFYDGGDAGCLSLMPGPVRRRCSRGGDRAWQRRNPTVNTHHPGNETCTLTSVAHRHEPEMHSWPRLRRIQ